jgi:hypothetical protein
MVGYEIKPEYDKYHFAMVSRKMFSVEGNFPRIDSSNIKSGISKANYNILIDACLPYELEPEVALDRLFKGLTTTTFASQSMFQLKHW